MASLSFTFASFPGIVVSSLVAIAGAQAPAPVATLALARATGVEARADGSCWLAGPDYKAVLAGDACEFVPALPAAPTNRTFAMTLRSVSLGDGCLYDASVRAATPVSRCIVGMLVQRDLGAVVERYEATANGVEQSFVVPEAPASRGDLVVRAAVVTDLVPSPRPDGGLDFSDGRHGGLRLGAVTGIDATGARCAGSMAFADGVLELRLPAVFVATARFPLTLDPLLGTLLLPAGSGLDDSEIELAYARSTGVWLATWSRTFSFADQDVRAQRLDAAGNLVGSLLAVVGTSAMEFRPAVAAVRSSDRFVVAWQTGPSPLGPWSIAARTVDAATGGLGTPAAVVANGQHVAVCGDRTVLGATLRFAWHTPGSGILACSATVGTTGTLSVGAPVIVDAAAGRSDGPWLSRSCASGFATAVIWSETLLGSIVRARAITHTGAPLGTAVTVASLSASGGPQAAVDGDGSDFLVVHETGTAIAGVRLTWNGSTLAVAASTPLANTVGGSAPAVAWLGDRYLVAWQMPTANPFQSTVRCKAFDGSCQDCGLEHAVATALAPSARRPAIAAQFSTTGAPGDALLGWEENALTPPFAGSLAAQRWSRQLGVPPQLLSSGCTGAGAAATNGPFALGNAAFRFELSGADPSAPIALLGLSDHSLPAVPCGCELMQAFVLYATLTSGGNASIVFPVPCNPALIGFALEYQWLLFGAAASPCPLVPGLVGGERWLLTLVE